MSEPQSTTALVATAAPPTAPATVPPPERVPSRWDERAGDVLLTLAREHAFVVGTTTRALNGALVATVDAAARASGRPALDVARDVAALFGARRILALTLGAPSEPGPGPAGSPTRVAGDDAAAGPATTLERAGDRAPVRRGLYGAFHATGLRYVHFVVGVGGAGHRAAQAEAWEIERAAICARHRVATSKALGHDELAYEIDRMEAAIWAAQTEGVTA